VDGDEFHGDGVGMELQPVAMGWDGVKAHGDGWGWGNFCWDGVGMGLMSTVHYRVTL